MPPELTTYQLKTTLKGFDLDLPCRQLIEHIGIAPIDGFDAKTLEEEAFETLKPFISQGVPLTFGEIEIIKENPWLKKLFCHVFGTLHRNILMALYLAGLPEFRGHFTPSVNCFFEIALFFPGFHKTYRALELPKAIPPLPKTPPIELEQLEEKGSGQKSPLTGWLETNIKNCKQFAKIARYTKQLDFLEDSEIERLKHLLNYWSELFSILKNLHPEKVLPFLERIPENQRLDFVRQFKKAWLQELTQDQNAFNAVLGAFSENEKGAFVEFVDLKKSPPSLDSDQKTEVNAGEKISLAKLTSELGALSPIPEETEAEIETAFSNSPPSPSA